MALSHLPLDQIQEADLRRLISGSAPESVYIDYKSETYGRSDQDRREFLADISSFANTLGGDLVIGMVEADGVAKGFKPLTEKIDDELRRLDDMARSGLQPPISSLRLRAVSIAAGGHVIIARVPRSYNPPHRVVMGGSNRFWARSSASPKKYEPNVEELRNLFNAASQFADRVRDFRADRAAKIAAGVAPVQLADGPLLVIHIVPYSAFGTGSFISLAEVEKQWRRFPPLGHPQPSQWTVGYDGFVALSNGNERAIRHNSYVHVFRNGIVEGVTTFPADVNGLINTTYVEATIIRYSWTYAASIQLCGREPPVAVMASLLKVDESKFTNEEPGYWSPGKNVVAADRSQLHFIESIFETVPIDDKESAKKLRQTLDHLAGVAGLTASPFFNISGDYTLEIPNRL